MGVEVCAHVGHLVESLKNLSPDELAQVVLKLSKECTLPADVAYHLTKAGHGLIHHSNPQYTSSEVFGKERQMIS